MAIPQVFIATCLAALYFLAVHTRLQPPSIEYTAGQCAIRPFEDLYTCHASPTDHLPGQSPGSWGLWDWKPVCFHGHTNQAHDPTYCLVSSAGYNDGHGVSIVAVKEGIQYYYDIIFKNVALSSGLKQPTARSYEKRAIPGKGVGILATKAIARGETFMTSFPAIIFDNEVRNFLEESPDIYYLYQRAEDQLANPQRVMSLAKSVGGGGQPLEAILRTNSHVGQINGRATALVYPEVAVCPVALHLLSSNAW